MKTNLQNPNKYLKALLISTFTATVLYIFFGILVGGGFRSFFTPPYHFEAIFEYSGWWVGFNIITLIVLMLQDLIKQSKTLNSSTAQGSKFQIIIKNLIYLLLLGLAGLLCILYVTKTLLVIDPIFANIFAPIFFYFCILGLAVYYAFRFKINSWLFAISTVFSVLSIVAFALVSFGGIIDKITCLGACNISKIYLQSEAFQLSIPRYSDIYSSRNFELNKIGKINKDENQRIIEPLSPNNEDISKLNDLKLCPQVIEKIKSIDFN